MRVVEGGGEPAGNGRRAKRVEGARELVDLELEKSVLGACMLDSKLVARSQIAAGDFHSESHVLIWNAIVKSIADAGDASEWSVREVLAAAGQLDRVGGLEYIMAAASGTLPTTLHFEPLRRLARERRIRQASAAVAHYVGGDDPAALERAYAQLDVARRELANLNPLQLEPVSAALAALEAMGPRVSLGLASLDEATRGGIPYQHGWLITLIGAPGASKTNLATWLANLLEQAGACALVLAGDERAASFLHRFGQMQGFDRVDLEDDDPAKRKQAARATAGRALYVVDPAKLKMTLEHAEGALVDVAAGRPRVLVVDSIQRVMSSSALAFDSPREQMDAKVEVVRGMADRGTIVIAISEMSRAGYRSGKRDQDISALGAGAESRSIEYQSDLALGLRSVAGEHGLIDVEVAKNRIGNGKPIFRLSLDFDRLHFRELGAVDDEKDDAEREQRVNASIRERVLAAVRSNPNLRSANEIGLHARVKRQPLLRTVRDLIDEGALVRVGKTYRIGEL